jgi:transcriptional regulator with XRE-family HTH domain
MGAWVSVDGVRLLVSVPLVSRRQRHRQVWIGWRGCVGIYRVSTFCERGVTMGSSRLCVRCGGSLSRYTVGELCNPCLVADRRHPDQHDRVVLPLEFWFQPEVRTALAGWRWDVVLQAIYRETGAAQAQLAYTAGVSQAQISRLIHAKSRTPTIQTVLGIVDGFGVPRLLAGLAPHGLDNLVERKSAVVDGRLAGGDVRRREFGKAVVVSLIPGIAGAVHSEPVNVVRLEPEDVVADLYALGDQYGGGAVADLAERRLRSIVGQIQDVSLSASAEAQVQRVMGYLSVSAGWFASDAGREDRTGRLYKDALYLAHLANDKALRLLVLGTMSMQATRLDRPVEGAHLAQAALSDARGTDPRLAALLTMRLARAASQLRDHRVLRESRHKAWRLLERAKTNRELPSWFRFFDAVEVTGLEGICAAHVGQHQEAAAAFRQVVHHQETYSRNKAVYSARLAEALARSGQVEESVAVLHRALPLLTQVTSSRVLERLADADSALGSYTDVSGVVECRGIIAGLRGR